MHSEYHHGHVSHIMNWHSGLSPVRYSSWIPNSSQGAPSLLRRFACDRSGSYVILSAVLMPVLVGTAGLGTEVGLWYYKHKNMQSAADSGAVSAATAGSNLTAEANAITASYGYANGVSNVTVAVNQPPKTGKLCFESTGDRSRGKPAAAAAFDGVVWLRTRSYHGARCGVAERRDGLRFGAQLKC
jgi:Flp pilus assembly protein TadG